MNISISPYSPVNSESVSQLFLELSRHEHKFDAHKSTKLENTQSYQKELCEKIKNQQGEMLIAKIDSKVVGLVSWFLEEEYEFDEPYGYISDIVVSEEYRGRGIGQQLLDEAISHIKATQVKRVHIGVLLANSETKSFYSKNGFSDYSVEMTKKLK